MHVDYSFTLMGAGDGDGEGEGDSDVLHFFFQANKAIEVRS